VLSQALKALERDGLVSRAVFPTVPVTVEYSITPLGATLAAQDLGRHGLGGAQHRGGARRAAAL
jgi:DNA-binding PadR family transcriptional regulator